MKKIEKGRRGDSIVGLRAMAELNVLSERGTGEGGRGDTEGRGAGEAGPDPGSVPQKTLI